MKAIAAFGRDPAAFRVVEQADPAPGGHDLLVAVEAISVNPVDTKVRRGLAAESTEARILGWDAAGVVQAVGEAVTLFKPGDRVWYAGDIQRPGSNATLQLVDERIVGHMPKSLSFAEAAALPLTAITAWELLFDRLQLQRGGHAGETLLVVGAAGGVGSVLIQLARQLTGITVIATASRPQSQDWVRSLGAQTVIDHSQPLTVGLHTAGIDVVDYVISLNQTDHHFSEIAAALKPQGKFALIDDPAQLDIRLLKRKSISLHWEFMFTRAMFATADMLAQHQLLEEVSAMVDGGQLRSTLGAHFGAINVENLRRAHAQLESGASIGKVVLAGFEG